MSNIIQLQFLNKVLQDSDISLISINSLSEDFFSDYKKEFKWIMSHYSKYGNCPDKISFLEEFPDFDIIEVNEPTNYLLDKLTEDYNKRKLASVFNKVRELLTSGKTDAAMSLYINAASDVVKTTGIQSVDIIKDTSRYDTYIEKLTDFNKFYIKTGFIELDEIIGGWDRNEELATLVARPGVGKSWVLQKIALAAAEQGLNVGIYSGEMSENKVGYRVDTLVSHLSNFGIMRGNSDIQTQYKSHLEKLSSNVKGSIKVLTPSMINGTAGVVALRAFIEKESLDMLCIDQHSLLEDDRRARTPTERASNISRDLKNLQVLKKIPIIAVSQQNREQMDEQSSSQVAQSDRISQDSTILLFLSQKSGVMTMNLVKARDSVAGKKLNYAIDLDKGIFNFIPDDKNTSAEELKNLKEEFDNSDYSNQEDVF